MFTSTNEILIVGSAKSLQTACQDFIDPHFPIRRKHIKDFDFYHDPYEAYRYPDFNNTGRTFKEVLLSGASIEEVLYPKQRKDEYIYSAVEAEYRYRLGFNSRIIIPPIDLGVFRDYDIYVDGVFDIETKTLYVREECLIYPGKGITVIPSEDPLFDNDLPDQLLGELVEFSEM